MGTVDSERQGSTFGRDFKKTILEATTNNLRWDGGGRGTESRGYVTTSYKRPRVPLPGVDVITLVSIIILQASYVHLSSFPAEAAGAHAYLFHNAHTNVNHKIGRYI